MDARYYMDTRKMDCMTARDMAWSDEYTTQIKDILYQAYKIGFAISSIADDRCSVSDMTAISGDIAIGVRVRKTTYRDVTFRARKGTAETELAKIRAGKGDKYLYCWSDGAQIVAWVLIDLDKLRASGLLDNPEIRANRDGYTAFAIISAQDIYDAGCISKYAGIKLDLFDF